MEQLHIQQPIHDIGFFKNNSISGPNSLPEPCHSVSHEVDSTSHPLTLGGIRGLLHLMPASRWLVKGNEAWLLFEHFWSSATTLWGRSPTGATCKGPVPARVSANSQHYLPALGGDKTSGDWSPAMIRSSPVERAQPSYRVLPAAVADWWVQINVVFLGYSDFGWFGIIALGTGVNVQFRFICTCAK